MDARSEILARIAAAEVAPLAPVEAWPVETLPPRETVVAAFIERASEYRAEVLRLAAEDVPAEIARRLSGRVVVPEDFDAALGGGYPVVRDEGFTAGELDGFDAVLTLAARGIAETGTLVLDHGEGQGRRALTLVPDRHVVILPAGRIVATVPEAVAALEPSVRAGRPLTWISGPSATSDIELERVEGVHGPRRLEIVIAG